MNLNELVELKSELKDIYEEELKKYHTSDLNKNIFEEELKDIKKEISKVDSLINIYQDDATKDYIVMELERLYMLLISELDKNQFSKLDENEMFEIFDKYFPDEWVLTYTLEQKEKLLLDAICENKTLVRKKRVNHIDNTKTGD